MPLKELQRLQAVNRFLKLEMDSHEELNEIVRVAADICEAPVALITLLDDETQHIGFQVGFDKKSTPARDAFCRYAIQSTDLLQVTDALKDPRFSSNPLVLGDPNIRFYAGAPLTTQDGQSLGSLCVIDTVPRELDNRQQKMLRILSRRAMQILEFELSIAVLKDHVIRTKQSENKLRSFFESSVSCHLLLGKQFEVLAYNKVVSEFINELFGIEIKEGMDIKDFVHKDHVGTFIENYTNALQ